MMPTTLPPSPTADSAFSITSRLSAMMFLEFFIWGSWYVSMTGWMNANGLTGLISWAYTVGPIAAIISPFFLGMIADRFFPTQRVLGVLHLLGAAAMLAVPSLSLGSSASTDDNFFHPYILLLFAHMLCFMPTLGLTGTLSFAHMNNPQKQFPLVRVFGTIGWIVGNIVVGGGLALSASTTFTWIEGGDKSHAQFYITGAAGILLGLFSFLLPHTPPSQAGKKVTIREILGLDALALMLRPSYLVFILCSFLICIPLAGYYGQARNFVEFVGFANPTFTMSYGQMSEILFMLVMPLCFARLGVKWMIAAGMLAWVLRYGLFSASANGHVAWMVLAGIVLHGICYDFFFVTGQIYVDKVAPKEIRGQAQGFLVLVTQGLGLGLGARFFGSLVTHYTNPGVADAPETKDWQAIWMVPSIFAVVILFIFVALFREPRRNGNEPA